MARRSWTVRPYQAGDERQAVDLFGRCFGRSMSEDFYRWKIQAGRSKPTNCMLAVAGDRIVGQYASWRVEALIQGKQRQIIVSFDGFVDPDFRRQGILTALVAEAHQRWQAEGVACVLGLPNDQWGSVNEKAGWQIAFPLKWHIRPLRLEKIALRRMGFGGSAAAPAPLSWLWNGYWKQRLRPDSQVEIEAVLEAGEAFDELWQRFKEKRPLSIVRDSDWINWRYLSVPGRSYRVLLARRDGRAVGYIVYWLQSFPGGEAGMVAEFLYEGKGVRDGLMAAAIKELRTAGVESFIGLAVPGTAESADFRRMGAFLSWGAFDVWILPLDRQLEFSLLKEPGNWLTHGGNFDVI